MSTFLVSIPTIMAKHKTRSEWEEGSLQSCPFLHDLLAASCEGNSSVSVVSGQHPHSFASTFSLHLPPISLTSQNSVPDSTFPGGWLLNGIHSICTGPLKWSMVASLIPVSSSELHIILNFFLPLFFLHLGSLTKFFFFYFPWDFLF